MKYWFIWFEVYEDGKFLTRGRYWRHYSHKSSAEHSARRMWSKPRYNPMTKSTITYKWVVSQEEPWERALMED